MIRSSDKNHWFVAPQTLTEIKFRFLISGKIYYPGSTVTTGELSCFAHIFESGPQKLPQYIIVVCNSFPGFKAHPVFTSVNDALRIFLMIRGITGFLIIIPGYIQGFSISGFI